MKEDRDLVKMRVREKHSRDLGSKGTEASTLQKAGAAEVKGTSQEFELKVG